MKQLPPGDSQPDMVPYAVSSDATPERPRYSDYAPAEGEVPSGGLLEYWRIVQRRRGTVVLVSFLGMLAGFLYTFPQTPIYQARTTIEIQGMNEDFLHLRDMSPTAESNSPDPMLEIQTQVRILQSRELLDRVAGKLKLQQTPLVSQQTRLDVWRKALHLEPARPAGGREAVIGAAAGGIRVRPQPNTRLIDISCDSINPRMAADFVNALASEFIEQNLEARWQTAQHTGEWLTRQMEDLKIKLEKSEDAMQAYARESGLLFTQEKDNLAEAKVKQIQEELFKAEADRIARQSRYELAGSVPADSMAEVLDDPNLKDIQGKLTDLRRQRAELLAPYTPTHPRVQRLDAQIENLESALVIERGNILRRLRNDFESAQRREKMLADEYAAGAQVLTGQADKVTHYNTLKREVDTTRQLYDNLLERVKEASIASALRASNIRVLDSALVPGGPYKPNLTENTSLGLLIGILCGIVFVVFLERADRTIQEPGDAGFRLGIPELGIVPSALADPIQAGGLLSLRGRQTEGSRPLALVTRDRRRSAMAESFRATLTSLMFAGKNGDRPRVIVLSSGEPREGKTTLTCNLALALAEIHQRVLLIEGDLRRPRLHHLFDLENDKGLVDILRSGEPIAPPLDGYIRKTDIPNLFVMTSGSAKESDPTLLYSERLREMLDVVRKDYDMVLIDTPPMLTMADARVFARHADAVVLVARANQTSCQSVKDAYERFAEDGSNVLGVVLNDWNPKKSGRYGYYRYYDRYKHYYGGTKKPEVRQ